MGGFALYSASQLTQLSGVVLTEFNSNLLRTKVDTPHNTRPVVVAKNVAPPIPPMPVAEKTLIADKTTIAEMVNTTYNSIINTELPTPEQFSVIKSRKGLEISWITTPSPNDGGLKFSVMVFEPVAGGGYLNKVYKTTEEKKVLIPRKSDFNPSKVLFGIVSTNDNGYQSPFPKLFRIQGKKIIFN